MYNISLRSPRHMPINFPSLATVQKKEPRPPGATRQHGPESTRTQSPETDGQTGRMGFCSISKSAHGRLGIWRVRVKNWRNKTCYDSRFREINTGSQTFGWLSACLLPQISPPRIHSHNSRRRSTCTLATCRAEPSRTASSVAHRFMIYFESKPRSCRVPIKWLWKSTPARTHTQRVHFRPALQTKSIYDRI